MVEGDHVYGLFEYGFEGVRWARGWRSFIEEATHRPEQNNSLKKSVIPFEHSVLNHSHAPK